MTVQLAGRPPKRPAPDPDAFYEAAQWFRSKLLVPDDEFQAMEDASYERAFTIAGVVDLDLVTDVWEAIDRAIANGEALDEFQGEMTDKLAAAWGSEQPWRVETIFRNAAQQAYNAGRYQQMNDPAVQQARPFRRFSAIMDARTTQTCSDCDGVILAADNPWWQTHQPPLHHNCRSHIVTMSEREAGDNVTAVPPNAEPAEGFGNAPTLPPWEPDTSAYPAPLVAVYEGDEEG